MTSVFMQDHEAQQNLWSRDLYGILPGSAPPPDAFMSVACAR